MIERRLERLTRAAAIGALAIAAVVLVGWLSGHETLKRFAIHGTTTKVNTAIAVAVLGVAVLLPRLRPACAWFVLVLNALILVEWISGAGLGIDELLFHDSSPISHPNRVAPNTSVALILLAAALLLRTRRRAARVCALAGGAIGWAGALGIVSGTGSLSGIGSATHIALPASLALVLLSVAVLAGTGRDGLGDLLGRDTPGGVLARRLLPIAVLVPTVLGALIVIGHRTGLVGANLAIWLLIVVSIGVLATASWRAARGVDEREEERRAAADSLHATNERLSLLLEASPLAIVTVDLDATVTSWNPAAERMFGWTAEEIVGQRYPLATEQEWHEVVDAIELIVRERRLVTFERRRRRKDGTRIDVSYAGGPLRDRAGEIVGIVALFTDISERKRAEAARQKFVSLVETSHDFVAMCTPDGRLQYVNPVGRELIGVGPDDPIEGVLFELFLPPEGRKTYLEKERTGLEAQGFWRGENRLRNVTTGEVIDVAVTSVLVHGDDPDEEPYVATVKRDISERKRQDAEIRALNAELELRVQARTEELQHANNELEAFAYSVAHDLRAPLRSIEGFSTALREDYGGRLDDEANRYIDRVCAAASRMAVLIDDLLKLSRISRAEVHETEVDLAASARKIAEELREQEPDRAVEFEIPPTVRAVGDPELLHVALENLLVNAWKFTSKHATARIEVGAFGGNGNRTFFVRDNGAGFDMAYASKLFGPFQRLHGSEFPGTGIGLATVQRVIHRHHGHVWAEGAPEHGATFYFTLGDGSAGYPAAPKPA